MVSHLCCRLQIISRSKCVFVFLLICVHLETHVELLKYGWMNIKSFITLLFLPQNLFLSESKCYFIFEKSKFPLKQNQEFANVYVYPFFTVFAYGGFWPSSHFLYFQYGTTSFSSSLLRHKMSVTRMVRCLNDVSNKLLRASYYFRS